MFAILVGAVTLKLFGCCVMQRQCARVLPAYLVAMCVTARTRPTANVIKFCRRVPATMYVHFIVRRLPTPVFRYRKLPVKLGQR